MACAGKTEPKNWSSTNTATPSRRSRSVSCAWRKSWRHERKISPHAQTIAALQAMRGIKLITAVTIVSEVGEISRFQTPRQLMAYGGLVPSEHSSGGRTRRGNITKNGNAHLRRVMVEAAWHNRHRPAHTPELRQRQRGVDPRVCTVAWNAQKRLHKRHC